MEYPYSYRSPPSYDTHIREQESIFPALETGKTSTAMAASTTSAPGQVSIGSNLEIMFK